MSVHFLPNDLLSQSFSLLSLKDLVRTSQVCRRWRDVSCFTIKPYCEPLKTEMGSYLEMVEKVFQEEIKRLDDAIKIAEEKKTKVETSQNEIYAQMDELLKTEITYEDMGNRWTVETELMNLMIQVNDCASAIRLYNAQKADLTFDYKQRLCKQNPELYNGQYLPRTYVFCFNKKLDQLTKIFNFCISTNDQEEWIKDLPKVIDLTLSKSKLAIKDLVMKKILKFNAFIKSKFESEEKFAVYQNYSKFNELMDEGADTSLVGVKKFFNDQIETLKNQPDDLNRLMISLPLLSQSFPFLVEQPYKTQIIGSILQPSLKIQIKPALIKNSMMIGMQVLNENNANVPNALDEMNTAFMRLTHNSFCFPTVYLTNALKPKRTYKLCILIGPYSITTGTFKVVE